MIYPKTVVFTGNVKGTTQNSLAVPKVSRTRPLSNPVYRTPNARTPVETKATVVTRDQSSISRGNSRNSFQITAGFKGHVPLLPSMTRSPVAAISDQHSHQPLPLPRGEVMLEVLEKKNSTDFIFKICRIECCIKLPCIQCTKKSQFVLNQMH